MNLKNTLDYNLYLPPYRSLLNPGVRYDYRTHTLVPIGPNELNIGEKVFRNDMKVQKKSSFKMKYSSLLNDMSKSMSMRITSSNLSTVSKTINEKSPFRINNLPPEIMSLIFEFIEDEQDMKCCMLTCKYFYQIVKSHFYRHVSFTSTYRFAQFVTYLRLNPDAGRHIKSIDLSGIKPCNYELLIEEVENNRQVNPNGDDNEIGSSDKILAGWRDWKFKNSSLYSLPSSRRSVHLSSYTEDYKDSSHSSGMNSFRSSKKFQKAFKYWGHKKKSRNRNFQKVISGATENRHSIFNSNNFVHPRINKYLMNYSDSKDIPIGYLVHVIDLCPNLKDIDLGNLSLSTDYEVKRSYINKFQPFDIMKNYDKNLKGTIHGLSEEATISDVTGRTGQKGLDQQGAVTSSASSIYSIATFSKPISKYTSLLPPLPQTVTDMSFFKSGDGRIFLSDLSLKSIDSSCLTQVSEMEILAAISKLQQKHFNSETSLTYLNLTSLIWLNKRLVQQLLLNILGEKVSFYLSNCKTGLADMVSLEGERITEQFESVKQNLVIDLTDSGMHKNLPWAKLLNFNTNEGCELASKIIKDESLDDFESFQRRERLRIGRIAENYFA